MPDDNLDAAFAEVENARDGLINKNIRLGARRTSCRLDRLTWDMLHEIARREGVTIHELCAAINAVKRRPLSLTVAIRIAVLQYHIDASTEAGHRRAGHGKIARLPGKT